MLTLRPFKCLFVQVFAASATGIRPSINIATIFGIIFITAAVVIPNWPILATSYPAKIPTPIPIINPIITVSPKIPNFLPIVSASASILLRPGIWSNNQLTGIAKIVPHKAIICVIAIPGYPKKLLIFSWNKSASNHWIISAIIIPKRPTQKLPLIALATNPKNAGNQKFQISTFNVFVQPSITNTKLSPNEISIIQIPNVVENASGPPTPQPISIILNELPYFSPIVWIAVPKFDDSKPITKSKPIEPKPTVIPEIIAFDNLTPKNNAIIIIIIGRKTVDPKPINHCNASTIFLPSLNKFHFYLKYP